MKKVFFTMVALLILGMNSANAQDRKVAVFDPAGDVNKTTKEIVREEISSVIVNTGGYTVLERQSIDKVLEENKFQQSGLVDDSQISEMGKRMGANLVFVSNIAPLGDNFHLSFKMIDVQTARIEKQKTDQTTRGLNDLISVVQKMVNEMFGNAVAPQQTNYSVVETKPATKDILIADKRKVLMNGIKLDNNEVRRMMVNTDALQLYNKGLSKNKTGNIFLYTGIPVMVLGATLAATGWDSYYRGYSYEYSEINGAGIAGFCLLGVGGASIVYGIVLKTSSSKYIEQSVDAYNRGISRNVGLELKFGVTSNGLGVALNF